MTSSITFVVARESEGGYTAVARIIVSGRKSSLFTDGDTESELKENILDATRGWADSLNIRLPDIYWKRLSGATEKLESKPRSYPSVPSQDTVN